MRLVELTYFNGNYDHPARIFVNPDHVIFLVPADAGSQGQQTWMRLSVRQPENTRLLDQTYDFLVQGSMEEVAAKLAFDYDPALIRETG